METESDDIKSSISELKLNQLKIIINAKFNLNYSKNIYDFFELFKIRVLKQIIYENKYFNSYKKLYSLRNIFIKSSIRKNKTKFKFYVFYYWYIKSKKERIKKNKIFSNNIIQSQKNSYLTKLVIKAIIKNERIDNNIPIMKRYLLLYMKYYNYLTDSYYIKSITIVKAIYNYFRKKLKKYKSIFFSRIDYNLQKDDFIYVYKYILTNYINDNYNKINYNNKRTQAILLLDNCNSIIKLDYNKNIKILSKENIIYVLLDKFVNNKFLVNKYISRFFSVWKRNSLEQTFIYNIQSREILRNDLMYSKILILVIIIKKKLKKYFEFFCNKIINKNQNKLIINLESIYNNILFNVLKGINCIQNYKNLKNSRIYNLNDDFKKLIVLKKWKGEKNIICNYNYNNITFKKNNLKIIKGSYIFDTIFLSHDFKRISYLAECILKISSNNINNNIIKFKLILFSQIIQNRIINIKRKIIIHILFNKLKEQVNSINKNKNISFLYFIISKFFSLRIHQYKIAFLYKLINIFLGLSIGEIGHDLNNVKNNFDLINTNKIIKRNHKIKNKLQAINIFIKYYQKNHIKNIYLHSLKLSFIHWCSIIGKFPSFILTKNLNIKISSSLENEDDEEIQAQKKEILELQKSLKEDKDFQHDLKAKISALDEENNFVNEKIYEITQRVENCKKCNNLIKSSYISDNKMSTSFGNIIKNEKEGDDIPKKSRNNPTEKEVTSSSGFNFVTGGTEIPPKQPRGFNKIEEYSDPESIHIDDENNDNVDKSKGIKSNDNEILDDTEIIKQKILDLKREKDPIVNKLKEEIIELYKELNMD